MKFKYYVLVMTIFPELVSCALTIKKSVGPNKTATGVVLYEQSEKLFKVGLKLSCGSKSGIACKQFSIIMR